jgi:histone deacetylase HOS3
MSEYNQSSELLSYPQLPTSPGDAGDISTTSSAASRQESEQPETAPTSVVSHRNDASSELIKSMGGLSIDTPSKTPLPPSSMPSSPAIHSPRRPISASPVPRSPGPRSPSVNNLLRRASSIGLNEKRSPSPALSRKASGEQLSNSRRSSLAILEPPLEEKKPLTVAEVAREYFERLLQDQREGCGVVAITNDDCYGHKYARKKDTTKADMANIVERPERLNAVALGVAAATVLIGDHHGPLGVDNKMFAEGRQDWPQKRLPLSIQKSSRNVSLVSPEVVNVHGWKFMQELKEMGEMATERLATVGLELQRTQEPGQPPKPKFHSGDLYLSEESLKAIQSAIGGTFDAIDTVFKGVDNGTGPSRAFVAIRPPGHHCSNDWPHGFCWVNNVLIGIEYAIATKGLTHAAIIDFDLHHGDGSQKIAMHHNAKVLRTSTMSKAAKTKAHYKNTRIGYFSLHDVNSFPCEDGDLDKITAASVQIGGAHGQHIWNIHLKSWHTEEEFWTYYEQDYRLILEKVRSFLQSFTNELKADPREVTRPKAAIFISAGFDASEHEYPGMNRHNTRVPTSFYARLTHDIVQLSREEGTGVDGRVISVLEGGYSDRALTSGVLSHLSGLCAAEKPVVKTEPSLAPTSLIGSVPDNQQSHYDPIWWHESRLTELEYALHPPIEPAPKKMAPRSRGQPTYRAPTQSFTAKVVDPEKVKRTLSGSFAVSSTSPSRAPTPPPPDVDWAAATCALSKLLIPSDKRTTSFEHNELIGPTRGKKVNNTAKDKEKDKAIASDKLIVSAPVHSSVDAEADLPSAALSAKPRSLSISSSTSDRRRTIAATPIAEVPPAPRPSRPRRLSAASNLSIASSTATSRNKSTSTRASAASRASVPVISSSSASVSILPPSDSGSAIAVKKTRATTTRRSSNIGATSANTGNVTGPGSSGTGGASKQSATTGAAATRKARTSTTKASQKAVRTANSTSTKAIPMAQNYDSSVAISSSVAPVQFTAPKPESSNEKGNEDIREVSMADVKDLSTNPLARSQENTNGSGTTAGHGAGIGSWDMMNLEQQQQLPQTQTHIPTAASTMSNDAFSNPSAPSLNSRDPNTIQPAAQNLLFNNTYMDMIPEASPMRENDVRQTSGVDGSNERTGAIINGNSSALVEKENKDVQTLGSGLKRITFKPLKKPEDFSA